MHFLEKFINFQKVFFQVFRSTKSTFPRRKIEQKKNSTPTCCICNANTNRRHPRANAIWTNIAVPQCPEKWQRSHQIWPVAVTLGCYCPSNLFPLTNSFWPHNPSPFSMQKSMLSIFGKLLITLQFTIVVCPAVLPSTWSILSKLNRFEGVVRDVAAALDGSFRFSDCCNRLASA